MIPDPYSFPADRALEQIAEQSPGVPVLGGISSARTLDGGAALFAGDAVAGDGAVGVVLRGVEVLPCVSQGAAPIGPELTVTAADGHVIRELDGRPGADRAALRDRGARRATSATPSAAACCSASAIGDRSDDAGAPDYLVRGIIGADPDAGTIAVGAASCPAARCACTRATPARPTATCATGLGLRREALGGRAAGALVFTCNGRGRAMFDVADHDADVVDEELGGVPAAGFLAAGEIGPGRRRELPARLHGDGRGVRGLARDGAGRTARARLPRHERGRQQGARHRRHRRDRPGDRARLAAAGAQVSSAGAASTCSSRWRRRSAPRRSPPTSPTATRCCGSPRARRRRHPRRQRRPVGPGQLTAFDGRRGRSRAGRQPARADPAHARLLPRMVDRGRGHLVYISSISGKVGDAGAALLGDEVRPARVRAVAAQEPRGQRRRRQRDLPRLHPRRGDVPRRRRRSARLRRHELARRTSPRPCCARSSAIAARSTSRRSRCGSASSSASSRRRAPRA